MFSTTEELLKQIRLREDSSLELKDLRYKGNQVNNPQRNSLADDLAAMANTGTGVLLLGVDDKSKSVVGIPEDKLDIVVTWITEICNDLITPQLFCRIRKIPVVVDDGVERVIVRVDVPKSLFVHQSPSGYFRWIGNSKQQMKPDVLARLFQQRSQARIIRFDELPVTISPRECLDKAIWDKFKTSLLANESDEDFLLKIKLLTRDDDDNICPSVSGVLMASRQPQEFLTNAFIQAVAYRGTEQNDAYQMDAKNIVGPLDAQIIDACMFVEKNMHVFAVKEHARRDVPQYAKQVIFEAVVNAVAHRDYSIQTSKVRLHMFADRLEIFSPGMISNTMMIESLPFRQTSRNELLVSSLSCWANCRFRRRS